ncbi:hypothetical protein DTO027B5_5529 [Paecilomyces variotii]|nr:hypothetical protein DTO032I3_7560 [Paecilomyces variotii]KAJ9274202.1 hypothetical protein DTO021D3_8914 [Paecilomyces variotii]KAJ9321256.1 hypothetical protein DTO027B3_7737 [Paecilomyces variotii]KAJ9332745.1 hypothetical protein DTO027B5_5529 [Paecilomyces variotii]KAJ9341715.1 hypothetical protein DTO027B6_5776 [Paecilomyces variotii]
MSPPLFDGTSRPNHANESLRSDSSRLLPSPEFSDQTMDDAYIAFILYCNPSVPSSVDTSELRRVFRSPPRSDGKSFSVFTLWELIVKLDKKELKTWIQLATELGVEPPSAEKKQSTQKVQQYAVRLKRWMRAMHIDAFFEYCLGHPHNYYTQIPSDRMPSESRDGVPLEEDLALTSLLPEWKPKRGRRKAEDSEDSRTPKRPMLDTSMAGLHSVDISSHAANFPHSAIPFSAFPGDIDATDPWVVASPFPHHRSNTGLAIDQSQDFRWRPFERHTSPAAYPHSAILPANRHASEEFMAVEPRSAVIPASAERNRTRRRHGPAISSAWSTHGNSPRKTRGRPPNKATTSSGQFSTFQVDTGPIVSSFAETPVARSSPALAPQNGNDTGRRSSSPPQRQPLPQQPISKATKLQLQVPQLPSGPVRLATPPTLLINGVDSASGSPAADKYSTNGSVASTPRYGTVRRKSDAETEGEQPSRRVYIDSLVKLFSRRLLHGKLVGRPAPLTSEEATDMAESVVKKLSSSFFGINPDSMSLLCAVHLGIGGQCMNYGSCGPLTVKMQPNTSTTEPQSSTMNVLRNWHYIISYEYCPAPGIVMNAIYDSTGATTTIKDTVFPDDLNDTTTIDDLSHDDIDDDEITSSTSESTWKQRYLKLKKQMRKKDQALGQYKRNILQAVMGDM